MPAMDEEAELLMAVYARFGLAMHYCAMIEWDVLTLMMASRMKRSVRLDLSNVTALLEGAYKDTIDRLIADLREDVAVTPLLSGELHGAFEIRRRLVTGYFRERALDLLSTEGRLRMLKEMNGACTMLQTVHERATALTADLAQKHGIGKDVILEELRRLMGMTSAEVS